MFTFAELTVGLNLPERFLALCPGATGPDCGGSGSPPPRPERSEVSLSATNQPGGDRLKEKMTEQEAENERTRPHL